MAKKSQTYEQARAAVQEGNVKPLYFVYGEEQLLADKFQSLLMASSLSEAEKSFNLDILYGAEVTAQQAIATCNAFPVMAERRVVIVRDFEKMSDNKLFAAYAERPNPQAVVALVCRNKPNLTHNPYRALKTKAVAVALAPPKPRSMGAWIKDELSARGKTIDPQAQQILKDFVGTDLTAATTELDKLVTFVGDKKKIAVQDVLTAAGQTREINVFELQNAVTAGDYDKAMWIAEKMLQQGSNAIGSALIIIAVLTRYYNRLWQLAKLMRAGVGRTESARRLGLRDFQLSGYESVLRSASPEQIRRGLRALMAAEFEIKGGSEMNEHIVMSLMLVQLMKHRATAS